jgi:hypothetical protein
MDFLFAFFFFIQLHLALLGSSQRGWFFFPFFFICIFLLKALLPGTFLSPAKDAVRAGFCRDKLICSPLVFLPVS